MMGTSSKQIESTILYMQVIWMQVDEVYGILQHCQSIKMNNQIWWDKNKPKKTQDLGIKPKEW